MTSYNENTPIITIIVCADKDYAESNFDDIRFRISLSNKQPRIDRTNMDFHLAHTVWNILGTDFYPSPLIEHLSIHSLVDCLEFINSIECLEQGKGIATPGNIDFVKQHQNEITNMLLLLEEIQQYLIEGDLDLNDFYIDKQEKTMSLDDGTPFLIKSV